MKAGEVFNPRYEACGFHPEEIVARRRDLTDGQKWLFDRMVRWSRTSDGIRKNERAGEVWRSNENMADELGKSSRQICRDLAKLESVHLIGHRKRDGRKSNTYFFLFHPSFEQTPTSGQIEEIERTPATSQTQSEVPDCPVVTGHPRHVECDLSRRPRPTNQKELNQQLESSIEGSGANEDLAGGRATTTALSRKNSKPQATPPWIPTAEEIQQAREAMQRHFGSSLLPDLPLTSHVLASMQSLEDVRLWLLDLTSRRVKPRSWGFYRADVATWPARRPDISRQVEAARIAQQQREAEDARQFAQPEQAEEVRPVADTPLIASSRPVLVAPRCVKCDGTGIREDAGDRELFAWCACAAGERRRLEAPDAVAAANALVLKLRLQFAPPAESASEIPAPRPRRSGSIDRKGLMSARDVVPIPPALLALRKA